MPPAYAPGFGAPAASWSGLAQRRQNADPSVQHSAARPDPVNPPTQNETMPAVLWRRRSSHPDRAVGVDLDLSDAGVTADARPCTAAASAQALLGQAPSARTIPSQPALGAAARRGSSVLREIDRVLRLCAGRALHGVLVHARLDGLSARLVNPADAQSLDSAAGEHGQARTPHPAARRDLVEELGTELRSYLPAGSWVEVDPSGSAWIVLDAVGSPAVALAWARRIELVLNRTAGAHAAPLGIALGLCRFPDQADTAQQVLVSASAASAQAQADRGANRSRSAFYDPERAEHKRRQEREAVQLAAALEHGGLELRLQGRAYVRGGALSAAQVELSWPRRRADRDEDPADNPAPVDPQARCAAGHGQTARQVATERRRTRHDGKGCRGAALERLAEQHHLADALGRALLARSCRQLSGWRRQGVAVPPLSLRLPGAWVGRADFAIELTQLLQRHHLSGRHLRLELGCAALRALQGDAGHLLLDAGIDLIADVSDVDLATLAACRRLPVACLAVDLATLGDITVPDSHARTTLATLTSLARGLGMRLLVKSVDHAEELELLGQLGADEYQGATLARPLPARTWTTLLSESTAGSLLDAPAPMAWPVLV